MATGSVPADSRCRILTASRYVRFSIRTSNASSRNSSPSRAPPDLMFNAAWGIPASWSVEVILDRGASLTLAAVRTIPAFVTDSLWIRSISGRAVRTSARSLSAAATARVCDLIREMPGITTKVSSRRATATAPPITRTRFSRPRSTAVPLLLEEDGEFDRRALHASPGLLHGRGIVGTERARQAGAIRFDQTGVARGFPRDPQAAPLDRDLPHRDLPLGKRPGGELEHIGGRGSVGPELLLLAAEGVELRADLDSRLDDVANVRSCRRELFLHEGARPGHLFPLGPAGEPERSHGQEDGDAGGDPGGQLPATIPPFFQRGLRRRSQRKTAADVRAKRGQRRPVRGKMGGGYSPGKRDSFGVGEGIRQRSGRRADQENRVRRAAGFTGGLPDRGHDLLGVVGHRLWELSRGRYAAPRDAQ